MCARVWSWIDNIVQASHSLILEISTSQHFRFTSVTLARRSLSTFEFLFILGIRSKHQISSNHLQSYLGTDVCECGFCPFECAAEDETSVFAQRECKTHKQQIHVISRCLTVQIWLALHPTTSRSRRMAQYGGVDADRGLTCDCRTCAPIFF